MLNLVKAQAWVLELQQMSNAQLRRLYGQGELMSHSEKHYHTKRQKDDSYLQRLQKNFYFPKVELPIK